MRIKHYKISFLFSAAVCIITFVSVLLLSIVDPMYSEAASGGNVSGYAWSENIGWISMTGANYGVNVAVDGTISGYAWSENIGWVSFNASDVTGCPSGTCAPKMDKTTGNITGWAKALNGGGANSGGWEGWISLSGAGYGISVDSTTCAWNGWAWGSDVVGWINFNGNGGTITGTGDACFNGVTMNPDLVAASTTVSNASNIYEGDIITINSNNIKNKGTSIAGPYTVTFYIDKDNDGVKDYPEITMNISGNTPVNGSQKGSVSWTAPSIGSTHTYRVSYIITLAGEINTSNNFSGWTDFEVKKGGGGTGCTNDSFEHCLLPGVEIGKESVGSCANGYNKNTKNCTYTCTDGDKLNNSNNKWTVVSACIPDGPPPIADPHISASPKMVDYGKETKITWTGTNSTCKLYINGAEDKSTKLDSGAGTKNFTISTRSKFEITCGSTNASVNVEVRPTAFET